MTQTALQGEHSACSCGKISQGPDVKHHHSRAAAMIQKQRPGPSDRQEGVDN